jgi:hypothetical protein
VAAFAIPLAVPNGDAFLLWHCMGEDLNTCNSLNITGGEADLDSIVIDQPGTVACLMPTATITTLATFTGSSTTVTEAASSTYFEEIVPSATSEELLTMTESSTIIETVFSTYFSTLTWKSSNNWNSSASRTSIFRNSSMPTASIPFNSSSLTITPNSSLLTIPSQMQSSTQSLLTRPQPPATQPAVQSSSQSSLFETQSTSTASILRPSISMTILSSVASLLATSGSVCT